MATLAEIAGAARTLNEVGKEFGLETSFELGRRMDAGGGWFLARENDAAVFLGATKADALRALEAFTDGLRIGLLSRFPMAVP